MVSLPCTGNRAFFGDGVTGPEGGVTGVEASSLQEESDCVELTAGSRPMFQRRLRDVPSGTRGFSGARSTARYEVFQLEQGCLCGVVPRAGARCSRRSENEEGNDDENCGKNT